MALFDRLLGERRAVTPERLFGTGLDTIWSGRNDAGVDVDYDSALAFSAIWASVRLLAGDISTFPLDAYRRGPDGTRELLMPQPRWISTPDIEDPSITGVDYLAQVAASLLLDGNAFIYASPSVYDAERLEVLNPRRVQVTKPQRSPEYRLLGPNGQALSDVASPVDIVHIAILRLPGELRGRSPVMANEQSIGIGLAAEKYIARFFGQGALMPGIVEVPGAPAQAVIDEMAKKFRESHRGWRHSGLLGFLTNGAKFTNTGITPKDADLTALLKFYVEQAARAYLIPPFMVGSQEPAGVAYASSVERAQHYIDHCLRHYVVPIEKAHDRLVPGDNRLRAAGSNTYVKLNMNALLRGDPGARAQFYKAMWEVGAYTPNRILALEDEPPFDDGDKHYFPSNFQAIGAPPPPEVTQ